MLVSLFNFKAFLYFTIIIKISMVEQMIKSKLTFIFVLMFSVNLFAGSIIKTKSIHTEYNVTTTSEDIIYIQDGKIRSETIEDGLKSITIINPTKEIMINIEPSENSYTIITKDDFSKFIEQIKIQKDKMLEQLPEEQREMMSKMFDQQMEEMKSQPKVEYKKVGNETLKGYACEVFHGFIQEEKIEEVWIASWENMKLKDEYVSIFQTMKKFITNISESLGEYGNMIEDEFNSEMFDKGFPIKTVEYEDGVQISVETLEEVTETDLSPSLFEIPKGMVQQDFFEM